jgi:hypothetical protein
MRYRAPRSSRPGCGVPVPTTTVGASAQGTRPRRDLSPRVACGGETVHSPTHQAPACGGEGHRLIPHIGPSPWRGWASHYPTHRALARGGDGHCFIPHIGHSPVEGMEPRPSTHRADTAAAGSAESSLPAKLPCGTGRRGLQCPDVVYRYQQLLWFPRRRSPRVACGGKDSAFSHTSGISLWRGGAQPYPTHRAQPVEGMGIASSHTSGTGPLGGWALFYPTHRALARGGDGVSSFHTSGRHCRSFSACRGGHPVCPPEVQQVESAISVSIWPWSA